MINFKTIFIILLLVLPQTSYSISITYRTKFKLTEDGNKLTCDNILDIGDSSSCFYCPKSYLMSMVSDSINRVGGNAFDALDVWKHKQVLGAKFPYSVFKNYPNKYQISVSYKEYIYTEQMVNLNWELTDEDTVILGYQAYGARARYRGRTWMVFYAPDITVEDGPWKLRGLPGLILFAKDSTDTYSFEAVGVSNALSRNSLVPWNRNLKRATAKQMMNLVKLSFADNDKYIFQTMGIRAQTFDAQGRLKKPDNEKASLIEYPR